MEITKVNFYPYSKKGNFRGYASITLDDQFVVSGIKLLEGKKGLFVSMPAQPDSEGEYHDICFPVTKKFRKEIEETIIDAYEAEDEKPKKSKKSMKSKKTK